ncbi:SUF system Fe-S cluster assembly protein [Acetobacter suratthaniensis]|uniref:SUF system Fe-S cluster assembly protein n=1 Tax=Acetobacter suratthaniensis TaxID=1502841 RepID=A0ABS3LL01_9PROT|nr:SUF system Fe-S cluster assembly protein [Acetobacter suratthaniensis]MBO1327598.1 SUF system Fe-S cluster assembly protein [Acetobacter suratthaniensis]MCX2565580.1 SUF system Fe-S cluster assembly protein [Acetobacter suratthaniensis]
MSVSEDIRVSDQAEPQHAEHIHKDVLEDNDAAGEPKAQVESWRPEGEVAESSDAPHSGAVSEDAVIEAIAKVHDPEIPVNIYELGLIYAIDLYDDGRVHVDMTLTAPNCPSAQELPAQVKEEVERVPGVTSADVDVVWDPPWDMSRMSDEARLALNMF